MIVLDQPSHEATWLSMRVACGRAQGPGRGDALQVWPRAAEAGVVGRLAGQRHSNH